MKKLWVMLCWLALLALQGCDGTASRVESVLNTESARTEHLRRWVRPESGADSPAPGKAKKQLLVFVHGFNSSMDGAWGDFPAMVKADQEFDSFNILLFGYPTEICGRVPDIQGNGELLSSYLSSVGADYDSVLLVGHSMGGLVVLNSVLSLRDASPKLFERLTFKVVTFGTPHAGVPGANIFPLLCKNQQVEGMQPLSDSLSRLHQTWQQRFGEGSASGQESRLVPVFTYYGLNDTFVPRGSACAGFEKYCEGVDGNHATMVKPKNNRDHLAYRKVKELARVLKPRRPPGLPVVEGTVRVAVLPFENLTGEAHLRDGMVVSLTDSFLNSEKIRPYTERAVLNRLVSERKLDNTSGYGESDVLSIGDSLGVDFVIWGTVQKYMKEDYRATIRLVELKGRKVLKPFFEEASDSVLGLQKQIFGRMVSVLDSSISSDRYERALDVLAATTNLKAYEHYVKGRNAFLRTDPEGYSQAIKWYEEAIRVDPKYSLAWAGIASAYAYWGYERSWNNQSYREHHARALQAAQKAVVLDPNLSDTHRALALVYAYWLPKPRREEAEVEARIALTINSNDYEAYFAIAKARDGNEEYLLKAIAINPDYILAYNWLTTRVYNKPERLDDAIAASRKILTLQPEHAVTHANLATLYLEKDLPKSALESAKLAVKFKPDLQPAHLVLGMAYFRLHSYPEARAALLQSLQLKEQDVYTNYLLGRIYDAQGETKLASEQWTKLLTIDSAPGDMTEFAKQRLTEINAGK